MAEDDAADVLVIFGITGDPAHKTSFRGLYRLERRWLLNCPFIGVAADDMTLSALVRRMRAAISAAEGSADETVLTRLASRVIYLHNAVTRDDVYESLKPYRYPTYYLEMPPALFGPIVKHLGAAKVVQGVRVVVEKPFGHDLASPRTLNIRLHEVLTEEQISRVDHFLCKEPVIELAYLRIAKLAVAQVWDQHSEACVQITMTEDFGVDDRGAFCNKVGALRDVVQNRLLQVLALVTMEPPASSGADSLRDSKAEVLAAILAADPDHYIRGQYDGHCDVPGVASTSTTEMFAALSLKIENDRWAGVSIFLRTGQVLRQRVTEVRLLLHRTRPLPFLPNPTPADANEIVLRIDPDPGVRVQIAMRGAKSGRTVHLPVWFLRPSRNRIDGARSFQLAATLAPVRRVKPTAHEGVDPFDATVVGRGRDHPWATPPWTWRPRGQGAVNKQPIAGWIDNQVFVHADN